MTNPSYFLNNECIYRKYRICGVAYLTFRSVTTTAALPEETVKSNISLSQINILFNSLVFYIN